MTQFPDIKFSLDKIHFVNETNKATLKYYNVLRPIMDKFIGQKIVINNNESFSSKFDKLIPRNLDIVCKPLKPNHFVNVSYYLNISYTGIYLNVTVCFSGGSYETKDYYCHYEKKSLYLGTFDHDRAILISLESNNDIIKQLDYTINIDEQKELIDKYNELLKQAEAVKSKINYSLR
jgi:hypothetical protein